MLQARPGIAGSSCNPHPEGETAMSFWDVIWFIIVSFVFLAYLMMLFSIIGDLFGDRTVSGGAKAAWMVALVFLPFLTAVIYLISRGGGMADRRFRAVQQAQTRQDEYIRSVAGSSPSGEIAKAQTMLDAGVLNQSEFDAIKQKALA
jgi:ABC-type multidrug transport system fused ATPase/permease subunit